MLKYLLYRYFITNIFVQLPTGNIADNNNFMPHQGVMDTAIKPVNPKTKMVGRAYTAQCFPGDNLALHQAIYAANPGDVLIIDCHGYDKAGHFGDIMATASKLHGLAGVVIDGSCRDSEDIRELGFPVFARSYNPAGTVKESLAKLGVPVTVGGITVRTGETCSAESYLLIIVM